MKVLQFAKSQKKKIKNKAQQCQQIKLQEEMEKTKCSNRGEKVTWWKVHYERKYLGSESTATSHDGCHFASVPQ